MRGPAHGGHRAQIVHLELMLQVLPPDAGDRCEAGSQARRVEQAVHSAELEHASAEEGIQTGILPHVDGCSHDSARKICREFPGYTLRHLAIEVSHHHVGALPGE